MKSQEKLKKKKGMRLAFKLSLTVSIPLLLITLIGIAISAGKQNSISKNLVEREVSGIAASVREAYIGDGRWCRFCDQRRYTEKGK